MLIKVFIEINNNKNCFIAFNIFTSMLIVINLKIN